MHTQPIEDSKIAGTGPRLQAFLVDLLVIVIIWILAFKFWGVKSGEGVYTITGLPALVLFATTYLYFVLPEIMTGRTLGKQLAGIRVVALNGEEASAGQVLAHHIMDFVDFMPCCFLVYIILVVATDKKQRVGDRVAGTIVIRER